MKIKDFKINAVIKQDKLMIIILFIYSFFIMLFFTKSSPLFFLNDWVDPNAFFTMGKGMIHGLVPYRDLFEQKGPLLYAIHAVAYLISNKTFWGVYIFESFATGVSLTFFYKTACYYMKPICAFWSSFFLSFFYVALPFFTLGDSAEEFAFPFVMGLIWLIIRLDKEERKVSYWSYFVQGVFLGCVFWMKFTLIGSWIGFFFIIFFIMLFSKNLKKLLYITGSSLAGFFCSSLPWFIYFGANHALKDLFEVYFKINMNVYPPEGGFISRSFKSLMIIAGVFEKYPIIFIFVIGGMLFAVLSEKLIIKIQYKYLITGAFLCNGIFAFWGGKTYNYYYLILIPFCSVGLLAVMRIAFMNTKQIAEKNLVSMTILVICSSIYLTFSVNDNFKESKIFPENSTVSLLEEQEKQPAQYIFAEIMNGYNSPTLLNYGNLDNGFYTVADILPVNRCFERQNIDYKLYPYIMDEQNEIILKKQVDFVVYRGEYKKTLEDYAKKYKDSEEFKIDVLLENYFVVTSHSQQSVNKKFTYWLLRKK